MSGNQSVMDIDGELNLLLIILAASPALLNFVQSIRIKYLLLLMCQLDFACVLFSVPKTRGNPLVSLIKVMSSQFRSWFYVVIAKQKGSFKGTFMWLGSPFDSRISAFYAIYEQ